MKLEVTMSKDIDLSHVAFMCELTCIYRMEFYLKIIPKVFASS